MFLINFRCSFQCIYNEFQSAFNGNENEMSIVYVVFAYSELDLHRRPDGLQNRLTFHVKNTGPLFMVKLATHQHQSAWHEMSKQKYITTL